MKKIAEFIKSEGVLCMLITFFVCSFLPIAVGFVVIITLSACKVYYTKVLSYYDAIGFVSGWLFSIIPHWIY